MKKVDQNDFFDYDGFLHHPISDSFMKINRSDSIFLS